MDDSWIVTGGLLAAIVGLMLFMEGLKLGLMPFGNIIGEALPPKSSGLPAVSLSVAGQRKTSVPNTVPAWHAGATFVYPQDCPQTGAPFVT
jgi:hypothetical protein